MVAPTHPSTHLPMRDNNTFHVLAKITFDSEGSLSSAAEQRHFLVHTSDEGRAVTLVKLSLNKFKSDNPATKVQLTVKAAEKILLPASTSPQEEICSLIPWVDRSPSEPSLQPGLPLRFVQYLSCRVGARNRASASMGNSFAS